MPAVARSARSLSRAPGLVEQARRALVCGLLILLMGGCQARPNGLLALYLRVSPEDLAGFTALELDPDWAGASRHPHRDAGWHRIPMAVDRVELEAARNRAAARPIEVAFGRLPAGRYDRVLVSTPLAVGLGMAGAGRQDLTSHVEPIARGFDLAPGEEAHIVIDLIVRAAPAGLARPELFVKRAELLDTAPWSPGPGLRP